MACPHRESPATDGVEESIALEAERIYEILEPINRSICGMDDRVQVDAANVIVHWSDPQLDPEAGAVETDFFNFEVDQLCVVVALGDAGISVDCR